MPAEIVRLTGGASDVAAIARAAAIIRDGGLVAFPTETVYGLGANALNDAAVAKIFDAKGRPAGDPLIVHLSSADAVITVAASVPEIAWTLMRRFWPGPLTLILERGRVVPLRVTGGGASVALRVPAHPVAAALLRAARVPIAAPSANRFSRPSPTTADDVAEDLGDRIDMILDGGPSTHGVESTVVDLTGPEPAVLRPGAITLEALRAVLPRIKLRIAVVRETPAPAAAPPEPVAPPEPAAPTEPVAPPESVAPPEPVASVPAVPDTPREISTPPLVSPGTLLKHYSPRAEVRLWTGAADRLVAAMRKDIEAQLAAGRRVGVLLFDEDRPAIEGLAVLLMHLGSRANLADAAASLFAAMRALDRSGVNVIVASDPGRDGLGLAIWDRLFRAAEGRVLESK